MPVRELASYLAFRVCSGTWEARLEASGPSGAWVPVATWRGHGAIRCARQALDRVRRAAGLPRPRGEQAPTLEAQAADAHELCTLTEEELEALGAVVDQERKRRSVARLLGEQGVAS
ncbi:MAG: hypothetical protein AB7N76_09620 [Planctomycetota bacterium]